MSSTTAALTASAPTAVATVAAAMQPEAGQRERTRPEGAGDAQPPGWRRRRALAPGAAVQGRPTGVAPGARSARPAGRRSS